MYVYASARHTAFLDRAAIDEYWSPGLGIGVRTSGGFDLLLGYSGDFGDQYEAHTAQLRIQLPF